MADVQNMQVVADDLIEDEIGISAEWHNADCRPLFDDTPDAWAFRHKRDDVFDPLSNRNSAARTSGLQVGCNLGKVGYGVGRPYDVHDRKRAKAASTSAVVARSPWANRSRARSIQANSSSLAL